MTPQSLSKELRKLRVELGRSQGLSPRALRSLRNEADPWVAYGSALLTRSAQPGRSVTMKRSIPVLALILAGVCSTETVETLIPIAQEAAIAFCVLAVVSVMWLVGKKL